MRNTKALVVISDTHAGSHIGLMPPGIRDDKGCVIAQNHFQRWLWRSWTQFWQFVDEVVKDEPWGLVHLGDLMDNRHHGTIELSSGNLSVQQEAAYRLLHIHTTRAQWYLQIMGTPAHCGMQSELEEIVAKELGALEHPVTKQHVWQAATIHMAGERMNFAHHIAHSGSHAYKSSPAMRLMAKAFAHAGEHGGKPPTMLFRGHSHDYVEVKRPRCRVVVCPCWQGKSGWLWMKETVEEPAIGGLVVRKGQYGMHIREKLFSLNTTQTIDLEK